jgi:Kef-type K+ transport system membrane component KefB
MSRTPFQAGAIGERSGVAARVWQGVVGIWGALVAVVPHVLHHVGPLAGAAILAGLGGRVLFFFLGLAVAFPMLRRLHRRFRTWAAPAIAVGVFALMYAGSTLVLGPLISDRLAPPNDGKPPSTTVDDHHGH